jgi:hypothetical protein
MGQRTKEVGLVCTQRLLHILQYILYFEYTQ